MKRIIMMFMLMPLMALATTLSDGLVAHYEFDGNAKDSSGNGNDGVAHGAILTADRFGNDNGAYWFDGNDWVQVNSQQLRNLTGPLTVSAWIKPIQWYENILGQWLPVMRLGQNDGTYGLQLQYQPEGSSYWVHQDVDGYYIQGHYHPIDKVNHSPCRC